MAVNVCSNVQNVQGKRESTEITLKGNSKKEKQKQARKRKCEEQITKNECPG